jgi:hypothetical protein
VRQDDPSLLGPLWAPPDSQRSGALIMGTRQGDVFVPTELLIGAETLGDEQAIRAWLAARHPRRTPMPQHCPRPQGLRAGGRLVEDALANVDG